ncbi:MAG: hypothetical protein PUD22_03975 [Erysipelotrichaceae bacterium]|nr:hypothetical protein [Erysipelotrichaceae bacterium]
MVKIPHRHGGVVHVFVTMIRKNIIDKASCFLNDSPSKRQLIMQNGGWKPCIIYCQMIGNIS